MLPERRVSQPPGDVGTGPGRGQAEGPARMKVQWGNGQQWAGRQVEGSEGACGWRFWKMASVPGEEPPGNHRPPRRLVRVWAMGWSSVASAGLDVGRGQEESRGSWGLPLGEGVGGTQGAGLP